MTAVIETHGLTKVFGRRTVVDAVDLTVERGEVDGFLGPNGAGKTTTLRKLLGLMAIRRWHRLGARLRPQEAGDASAALVGYEPQLYSALPRSHGRGDLVFPGEYGLHNDARATGWRDGWLPAAGGRPLSRGLLPLGTQRWSCSRPRCCISRSCSCSTTRPSAWTPSSRRGSGPFSADSWPPTLP